MKFISTKRTIIAVISFMILGYLAWSLITSYSNNTFTVVRGSITQEVSETGRIISEKNFDLSFKTSGIIKKVYAKVGEEVKKGDPLAELDTAELQIQLDQAKAQKATAIAKLKQLTVGATTENVSVYESAVANAKTNVINASTAVNNSKISLNDAKSNLVNNIQDAFTNSDDAIRNRVDQFFSNPRTANPIINFPTAESILKPDVEWKRIIIETTLVSWKSSLSRLTTRSNLVTYTKTAKNNLNKVKSFLDKIALAVNGVEPNTNLSQAKINAWKLSVSTARNNVNISIGGLLAAEEKINNTQSAIKIANGNLKLAEGRLQKAKDELASIKASPRGIDISVLENQVKVAQGSIELLQKELRDTVLRASGAGVVTRVSVETGERVAPNRTVISIISKSRFELEAYIPEESITEIKQGLPIKFMLDAFPLNNQFNGKVILIEPEATVIEGEVYYKVKGEISKDIQGIRDGMTADINIIIDKRNNVLKVPVKAVKDINGKKTVLLRNGLFTKVRRTVETGLHGGGFIEITNGLNDGDTVIIK